MIGSAKAESQSGCAALDAVRLRHLFRDAGDAPFQHRQADPRCFGDTIDTIRNSPCHISGEPAMQSTGVAVKPNLIRQRIPRDEIFRDNIDSSPSRSPPDQGTITTFPFTLRCSSRSIAAGASSRDTRSLTAGLIFPSANHPAS